MAVDSALDRVGWLDWFSKVYLAFSSLGAVENLEVANSGLGSAWTRTGGMIQGCPWSMVFIVGSFDPLHIVIARGAPQRRVRVPWMALRRSGRGCTSVAQQTPRWAAGTHVIL